VPETDDVVALCVEGEFDMTNSSLIAMRGEEVLGAGKHLILDLSEATFIDSHVVHALFTIASRARRSGRVAVLELHTAGTVETVLEVCRVERVIPRVNNRSDAIHTIRQLDVSIHTIRQLDVSADKTDRHATIATSSRFAGW